LGDEDIETLAKMIANSFSFAFVLGIPTGGLRLAHALKQYATPISDTILIVDDVLTTGNSMERAFKQFQPQHVMGVVIFARGKCPDWITPIFTLNDELV
jgi:hypoxanthine phosphoribosyltransferase